MHSYVRLSGIVLATLLATSSLSSPTRVGASAPMAKKAAPGFYRLMLGKFEVTALSDGTFDFPVKDLLTNVSPSDLDEALAKSFLTSPYQMSINGFLVNTGERLVLIDAGLGALKDTNFQNEGDNEITGIHVSDGDATAGGLLGAKIPSPFEGGWRMFYTQQHGENTTWEVLKKPSSVKTANK